MGSEVEYFAASHNCFKVLQFVRTDFNKAALTVQWVGHKTRKPGESMANSSLSFSKCALCFGENFVNFETSKVQSRAL